MISATDWYITEERYVLPEPILIAKNAVSVISVKSRCIRADGNVAADRRKPMRMYDIIMKRETAESYPKKRFAFLLKATRRERYRIIRCLL